MKGRFQIILAVLMLYGCSDANIKNVNNAKFTSPNKKISVNISVTQDKQAFYNINYNNQVVIKPSMLGIELKDRKFTDNVVLIRSSAITVIDEHYQLFTGKQSDVDYLANQQSFIFENDVKQQLEIIFRISNDGVAFRYKVLGKDNDIKEVVDESTRFAFSQNTKAWLQPIAVAKSGWNNTNPSYEEHYQMEIPVGQISPSPAGWVFPALFNTGDTWVAITEAGLAANSHASRLQANSSNGEYKIGKPMDVEVFTNGALMLNGKLPLLTSWRVLAIGDLATVANSTIGTDLADPAISMNTDYIKPGISSWSWGLLKDEATVFDIQKEFVDHAADMNWQYTLVDADWDRKIGDEKMQQLVEYANSKNVDILVWYNSSGDWNTVPLTPKSSLLTAETRAEQFSRLVKMGIKGLKMDFFGGDGQSMIQYYHDILRDADKYKLLVNFHGATLPRGWQRTYPNLMTVEAVKGFEMITFSQESADHEASHSAMLPFTRNLFDPMDFTPTTFNDIPNIIRKTSNAFELAQTILFTSGIQHIVETPEGMKKVPSFVKSFLQNLPAQWHESKYISGYPGKLAVFARRYNNTWYIAGINGENKTKELNVDFSFLMGKEGQFIHSGNDDRQMINSTIELSQNTLITLKGNDGFIIKIDK